MQADGSDCRHLHLRPTFLAASDRASTGVVERVSAAVGCLIRGEPDPEGAVR